MRKPIMPLVALLPFCFLQTVIYAQDQKHFTERSYFWLGSVNTIRFNAHWGMIADFHYRTSDFLSYPYYYITRMQGNYWVNDRLSAGIAYAHTWSRTSSTAVFSNENRIAEQFQVTGQVRRFSLTNRWRLEQRWQQKILDNEKTHDYRFTNRLRYAVVLSYSPFPNKSMPSLMNYDELMLQFGKEITYNTFDQCRLYLGIRQKISPQLNIDVGYMYLYQQQLSGNQYIKGNALRVYFNYNTGWKKDKDIKRATALVTDQLVH